MQFARLCDYFARIEATPKRLEKTALLKEILAECAVEEVRQAVYLCLGILSPKYTKLEFNMADKMVVRAVAFANKKQVSEVWEIYKKVGDLGSVAEEMGTVTRGGRIGDSKEVAEIYEELAKVARMGGQGSQEQKVAGLAKLLKEASGLEAKYIVRMVLSKLRLGFFDKTVLDTLSILDKGDKSARETLDRLYQIAPDVGELAVLVKKIGVDKARGEVAIELGRPVIPALAQRLESTVEMIQKMGKVIVEAKYDGTRVQVHYAKDKACRQETARQGLFEEEGEQAWVRTFTRNLDESTNQFPELLTIGEQVGAREVILDAEAVGYDPKSGELVNFQTTIKRKRKNGIREMAEAIPLKFFVFDILYLDGESLLDKPLFERREILKKTITGTGPLVVDEIFVTENANELSRFHKDKLAEGLEGVMVKKYDGAYTPGRQAFNWVKHKEVEGQEGKLLDTIDVLVMGYYRGRGKRVGFGMGALLVGIQSGDSIVTIAKIGTGLSDALFHEIFEKLQKLGSSSKDPSYLVDKSLLPDEWVSPNLVLEVAADEVTVSPTHSSGYALRFPRLVRVREDKDITGVTTIKELVKIGKML